MKTDFELEDVKDKIGNVFDEEGCNLEEMHQVLSEMAKDTAPGTLNKRIKRILRNVPKKPS